MNIFKKVLFFNLLFFLFYSNSFPALECEEYLGTLRSDFYLWIENNNLKKIEGLLDLLICEARVKKVKPEDLVNIFKNDLLYFKKVLDLYEKLKIESTVLLKSILISIKNGFSFDIIDKISQDYKNYSDKNEYYSSLNRSLYFFLLAKSNNVQLDDNQMSHLSYLVFKNNLELGKINKIINILLKIRGKYKKGDSKIFSILKEGIENKSINSIEENIKILIKDN